MRGSKFNRKEAKLIVKDKMQCLDDFGICSKDDEDMVAKLYEVIEGNPNKDPRVAVDMYCRKMIQDKINSWV